MNCSNCGAPLTPVAGRDYFQCKHCETLNFPEPLADSADGIASLGEPGEHVCPICSERLLLGSIAMVPVGEALAGWGVDRVGVPTTLVWCIAGIVLPTLAVLSVREVRELRSP